MATYPITKKYITGNRRYRAAEIYVPSGVALHSIGTPQPDANKLWTAWNNDSSGYVTQYLIDDKQTINTLPDNFKTWHIGGPGNDKWIGIEMCEPSQIKYTSGATFTVSDKAAAQAYASACYNRAVDLIAQLCTKYGWNPQTAVYTHGEVTKRKLSNTDHVDPEHLWNGLGLPYSLATLRNDVAAAMTGTAQEPPAQPQEKPQSDELYRIRKSWDDAASQIGAYAVYNNALAAWKDGYAIFDSSGKQVYPFKKYAVRVIASALNVRKGPSTQYAVDQTIPKGGAYTIIEEYDGWGLLKAYEKARNGWINLAFTERI